MATCDVRQENDEMVCKCGLRWETRDPEPPACLKNKRRAPVNFVFAAGGKADALGDDGQRRFFPIVSAQLPLDLPGDLATEMSRVYEAAASREGSPAAAMQAAYRLFLDRLP